MAELSTDNPDPASRERTCCGSGTDAGPTQLAGADVRAAVRERYAAAARGLAASAAAETIFDCCSSPLGSPGGGGEQVFGATLYAEQETEGAVAASLGCGVPTAVADLRDGETVLDLGSGAGADVLISAKRVGPQGRVIGIDMTDEMLELACANARRAGVENVEFLKGFIEEIPLADHSVDVVISNCVLNLSADKPRVIREVARVLRPGGRIAVSDVLADPDMDATARTDMQNWTGCIAGALTREAFEQTLANAGFVDIEIRETHRVHEHASSAIVRARRPA